MTIVAEPRHWESRAVRRRIEPGSHDLCPRCDEALVFRAKIRASKVICNIYTDGRWERVEHWHERCYDELQPYGPASE